MIRLLTNKAQEVFEEGGKLAVGMFDAPSMKTVVGSEDLEKNSNDD